MRPSVKCRYQLRNLALLLVLHILMGTKESIGAQGEYHVFGRAQSPVSAEIIYIGPGDSTYSLFAHVAIRLKDSRSDLIYDLGITSHLGVTGLGHIAMGSALFHGERRSFQKMLKSWRRRDRDVIAYPLNFTDEQLNHLRTELESRTGTGATSYLYDPLRENCGTQLRQVLDLISEGALSRSISKIANAKLTFRDDTRDGYAKRLGVLAAIELIVGPSLDLDRGAWALAYRPQRLIEQLRTLRIGMKSLLGQKQILNVRQGPSTTGGSAAYLVPLTIMIILLVILLSLWAYGQRVKRRLLRGKVSSRVALWITYYGMTTLSVTMTGLAFWLSLNSVWIEVRNSWLLILGSPLDLFLFSVTPKSSRLHQKRALLFLRWRGITMLASTLVIFAAVGELPTLTTLSFTLLTSLACYLCLYIIESSSSDDHSIEGGEADASAHKNENAEGIDPNGRSWLEI